MARGRLRYQRGRVVATDTGGWEIHYNIYLSDPETGKPKRSHRSRVVSYKPKMRRADAEAILAAELAAINGGPVTCPSDGTMAFGDWMRNFYVPMRGANWRDATRKTNTDYLKRYIRGAPYGNASAIGPQRSPSHPERVHADARPGSDRNGESSYESHPGSGSENR